MPGEAWPPEDNHMALVYHNVDPDVSLFSIGNSIPGIISGPYTFSPKDTGYVDRRFYDVIPNGQIYKYDAWYHCSTTPDMQAVFLLQMIDDTHLKIEKIDTSANPPWSFTNNAVIFER